MERFARGDGEMETRVKVGGAHVHQQNVSPPTRRYPTAQRKIIQFSVKKSLGYVRVVLPERDGFSDCGSK